MAPQLVLDHLRKRGVKNYISRHQLRRLPCVVPDLDLSLCVSQPPPTTSAWNCVALPNEDLHHGGHIRLLGEFRANTPSGKADTPRGVTCRGVVSKLLLP